MYKVPVAFKHRLWRRVVWVIPFLLLTIYFYRFWMLLFVNGLVSNYADFGYLPAFIVACCCAYGALKGLKALYRLIQRSHPKYFYLVYSILMISAIAWLAYPYPCDVHDSWVDPPDRVCNCRGRMVRFYEGNSTDGSTVEFCIGWKIFLRHS
jgi:hypothetical protein